MYQPKWSLFYDNHTMPECPEVGENFDAEKFITKVKDCNVDFLCFHARCNMGMAYYDTLLGNKHPNLKKDVFGAISKECEKNNILLSAYFNLGLSHAEGVAHPDWLRISPEGKLYSFEDNESYGKMTSPFIRKMCFNSPYIDHVIAMLMEVMDKYKVEGFFFDCVGIWPCICPHCVRKMKEQGLDFNELDACKKFAEDSAVAAGNRIAGTLRKRNSELLIYFNYADPEKLINSNSYMEIECLPTGHFGYECLPLKARYFRTLNRPVLNMTGRFHRSWGDFGGIRRKESIRHDCLYGLANGIRANIGGHFHPRGDINNAVFEMIESVYKDLQRYEPWFEQAYSMTDVGLVTPAFSLKDPSLSGAGRMLCELKTQFDIVTPLCDWEKYKLLILPGNVLLNEETERKIMSHLNKGGQIISCEHGGMNADKQFPEQWPVEYTGECPFNPAYMTVNREKLSLSPDMPLDLYSSGICMDTKFNAESWAELIAPFFNREWDGVYGNFYAPPDKATGKSVLVVNNQVAHFSHELFRAYYNNAFWAHRDIVGEIIDYLHPEKFLKVWNLPSFARATLTKQSNRIMVHLLCYVPELRGKSIQMVEEAIEVSNVKIALRKDLIDVKRVYLAPDYKTLEYVDRNGYIEVLLGQIKGYEMIVFEA